MSDLLGWRPGPVGHVLSVSELTAHIKALLESDELLADVWVTGEVSNCRPAASGHWYWTLKDEEASLNCVMWRSQAALQAHLPADGASFVLHGVVSVYPRQGQYQLYVDRCQPAGLGDLFLQFERLKAKLAAEGLFDAERKRALPRFPVRIGVVTSTEAAALRDICHVVGRRWPLAELLVAHTTVQGDTAPDEIVAALTTVGRAGVDVVIVARGGGSIEDLWAFNDERVARAIAACPVPVITGIGHETDTTIADFVADRRAATPSASAEMAVPDRQELRQMVDDSREQLRRRLDWRLQGLASDLGRLRHRLALAAPERRLAEQRRAMESLASRLATSMHSRLRLARSELTGHSQRLEALAPAAILARGYAHVLRRRDRRTVRAADEVAPGEALDVHVARGQFGVIVEGKTGASREGEGHDGC